MSWGAENCCANRCELWLTTNNMDGCNCAGTVVSVDKREGKIVLLEGTYGVCTCTNDTSCYSIVIATTYYQWMAYAYTVPWCWEWQWRVMVNEFHFFCVVYVSWRDFLTFVRRVKRTKWAQPFSMSPIRVCWILKLGLCIISAMKSMFIQTDHTRIVFLIVWMQHYRTTSKMHCENQFAEDR